VACCSINFARVAIVAASQGLLILALLVLSVAQSGASEIDDVKNFFRSGDYEACIKLASEQVEKGVWNELWPRMLIESYLAKGDYPAALRAFEKAKERFGESIRMRLVGVRVYKINNAANKAEEQLDYLEAMYVRTPWRFTNKSDLVAVGDFFLARGADPKEVLKNCYDPAAKSSSPAEMFEAHMATARMAIDKNDDKVASQSLAKAIKLDETDPELFYLLGKSWIATDPAKSAEYFARSIALNPKFVPSLIHAVEARMSAEDYDSAEAILAEVEKVNSNLPKLWALRAAIAHLQGRYEAEGDARRKGLLPWALNPEVDFTIGKQLAMHYRFTESVEYQTRALKMDADYAPAKTQLAQDLLRLGKTGEGWELVDAVRKKDPYDVTVFNLRQLKTELEKFATLEAPGFVIRMDAREARIYGQDVVQLLSEARDVLTKKYAVQLEEPVYVEIFPKQKEFAIRTFGMPGGEGFLGVCFGRLITANSPAALQVDSNWKAVLWHEYCHVVTLQKTKNKMPRWLSEGISVYEERQRNATWGQSMDPLYREMILGTSFVPVSKLSGAFLQPKSPMHLQFAYYESSLVVEYWIEKYGIEVMRRLLDDLSIGMPANEALKRAPGTLELLDKEFQEYAMALASKYGDGVDFERANEEENNVDAASWLAEHPENYWRLRSQCIAHIKAKKWDDALATADKLKAILPNDDSNEGIYALLAKIHRGKGNEPDERAALIELSERSSDCREALLRLIEIDEKHEDWTALEKWCEAMQAINPIRSDLQELRAKTYEKQGKAAKAAESLSALLDLQPTDPASIHYRLAVNLRSLGKVKEAKRHVLLALEESPRYKAARMLLVELVRAMESTSAVPSLTPSSSTDVEKVEP
jgi:tetratricopeptide (TPR) repeat protein